MRKGRGESLKIGGKKASKTKNTGDEKITSGYLHCIAIPMQDRNTKDGIKVRRIKVFLDSQGKIVH